MAEGDASTLGTLQLDDPAEFRMRFLNYNMANSSRFANLSDLPGHLGPKKIRGHIEGTIRGWEAIGFGFLLASGDAGLCEGMGGGLECFG